ncbi:MAG TPA: hypothetical protein DDW62_12730 [Marinilabiliaceae bacterium]|nr:hypothetical protein [Marinilabiliaceae bacterium]
MKKLQYILLAILAISFSFSACTEEEPFETITADDEPRILNPIFANGENGQLPLITEISRDANLTMELTVPPSTFSTVTWLIDGYEVNEGTEIDMNLKAGSYHFKVLVTTGTGKSTFREGIVKVNPLANDPQTIEKGVERIITPGGTGIIYGYNLNLVKSLVIGGLSINDFSFNEDPDGDYLQYSVPNDLSEGKHRILLVDEGASDYGGNTVTVTGSALATGGISRVDPNSVWHLTGLNMDQIASITLGGQTITSFTQQTATELVLTSPNLEAGSYTLTGKTKSNTALKFYSEGSFKEEISLTVSSETVLYEGHHYISWELPDGDPNKTFNLIAKEVFAAMSPRTTLNIHYSLNPGAGYWQMQTTTGWWTALPGTGTLDLAADGFVELVMTQEMLDLIQAQDGFLCVGHGYYVDRVSIK